MSYIQMQCRRGMLELDVIFERFLQSQYDLLSKEQQNAFELLLKQDDPILYDWLVSEIPCPDMSLQNIVKLVLETDPRSPIPDPSSRLS